MSFTLNHKQFGQGEITEFNGTVVHIRFGDKGKWFYIPLLLANKNKSIKFDEEALSLIQNHMKQIIHTPAHSLEEMIENCAKSNETSLRNRLDQIKKSGHKIPQRAIDDQNPEDLIKMSKGHDTI